MEEKALARAPVVSLAKVNLAAATAFSSVTVVTNALGLRRTKVV